MGFKGYLGPHGERMKDAYFGFSMGKAVARGNDRWHAMVDPNKVVIQPMVEVQGGWCVEKKDGTFLSLQELKHGDA